MFLKSSDKGLEGTERFLHSRGWDVQIVVGSLNKGLQVASAFNPDYLFICTEIIPKEFSDLFSALQKSFHVILFAERPDAHALRLLQQLGAPNVILTPLTGPAVERMIFRVNSKVKNLQRTAGGGQKVTPLNPATEQIDINRMANATDQALSEICKSTPDGKRGRSLGKCSSVHCFAVYTKRFCGYIVVAASVEIESQMTEVLRYKIGDVMEMSGEFFRSGEIHSLHLEEVQFEGLALSYGEFLKKAYHLGNEIAIALFRIQETGQKVSDSPEMGWVSTALEEISPSDPVDFDVYIYLPLNKKFVLYRRAGSVLEEEQILNLEGGGVKEIHLKKESVPELERYRARKHLNSLIANYRLDNTEITAA